MRSMLSTSEYLQVREYKLSNDLTVWLNEDHSQPMIFGAVVVKAGAADTPDTGIAHYFEHMMFKGTDKIGTIDYESERALLDIIEKKYDALADTTDPEMRLHLQKIINDLSVRAADYVIPNEFDRMISRFGGSELNAATSFDYTLYYNTFSPQYVAQWAEINSERLLNPVFRLFQSELETVYEEKNMLNDSIGGMAMMKLMERYFYPHPYAYPVIGSAENLKNPRLSEMRRFFDKYYVASNMGLIMSGDFDSEHVLPILEATFSRIKRGEAPVREMVELPGFKGREKLDVKIPMPFVKAMVMGFRSVPATHPDQTALSVALSLLNNPNGTGLLDRLAVDHKVLAASVVCQNLNQAGLLGIFVVPKLLFQSYSSAEKLVWKQINMIKNGEFSDEMFESLKLDKKRGWIADLEDVRGRANVMMGLFQQGKSWQDYLDEVARIESLTKQDVIDVANRYFTSDYLFITKKTGRYFNNYLPKPDFAPIIPKHYDATSDYMRRLEKMPSSEIHPHFIDFEKDMEVTPIAPLVKLYSKSNPVNDIFSFVISYGVGSRIIKELSFLGSYLSLLGTETMSYERFTGRMQELGAIFEIDCSESSFQITVNGFDSKFKEVVELLGDFMRNVKVDNKKMKLIVDEAKVMEKSMFESNDGMANVLLEKVKFGDQSQYLTRLSLKDVKRMKGKTLIDAFNRAKEYVCDLHYCGNLPKETVLDVAKSCIPIESVCKPYNDELLFDPILYDKPKIFFYEMKGVSQCVIHAYMRVDGFKDERERYLGWMFNEYFGGDMSSIIFQEIREFRSYAYQVSSILLYPRLNLPGRPGSFVMRMATQADKSLDAIEILETLVRDMPVRPERIKVVKQSLRNTINNDYPSFRSTTLKAAAFRRVGHDSDPHKNMLEMVESMDMDDILRFYNEKIKDNVLTYAIVGDSKLIDMKRLSKFGEIIKVKKKHIYR